MTCRSCHDRPAVIFGVCMACYWEIPMCRLAERIQAPRLHPADVRQLTAESEQAHRQGVTNGPLRPNADRP